MSTGHLRNEARRWRSRLSLRARASPARAMGVNVSDTFIPSVTGCEWGGLDCSFCPIGLQMSGHLKSNNGLTYALKQRLLLLELSKPQILMPQMCFKFKRLRLGLDDSLSNVAVITHRRPVQPGGSLVVVPMATRQSPQLSVAKARPLTSPAVTRLSFAVAFGSRGSLPMRSGSTAQPAQNRAFAYRHGVPGDGPSAQGNRRREGADVPRRQIQLRDIPVTDLTCQVGGRFGVSLPCFP